MNFTIFYKLTDPSHVAVYTRIPLSTFLVSGQLNNLCVTSANLNVEDSFFLPLSHLSSLSSKLLPSTDLFLLCHFHYNIQHILPYTICAFNRGKEIYLDVFQMQNFSVARFLLFSSCFSLLLSLPNTCSSHSVLPPPPLIFFAEISNFNWHFCCLKHSLTKPATYPCKTRCQHFKFHSPTLPGYFQFLHANVCISRA